MITSFLRLASALLAFLEAFTSFTISAMSTGSLPYFAEQGCYSVESVVWPSPLKPSYCTLPVTSVVPFCNAPSETAP